MDMATHELRVMVPPRVAAPRGAAWAALIGGALMLAAHAVWRALQEVGRRRAARELHQLARHQQAVNPKRARMLREAGYADMQGDAR